MSSQWPPSPSLPPSAPTQDSPIPQPQQPAAPAPAPVSVPVQVQVSPAQRTAEARTAFTASLHSAASNLDADLQSRAKNIHANAKALQKQQGDVEREVKGLRRKNDELEKEVGRWGKEWSREVEKIGLGPSEGEEGGLGNFDLEGIERDLGALDEWVRIVEEEEREEEECEGAREGSMDQGEGGVQGGRSASSEQIKGKGVAARETRTGASVVK